MDLVQVLFKECQNNAVISTDLHLLSRIPACLEGKFFFNVLIESTALACITCSHQTSAGPKVPATVDLVNPSLGSGHLDTRHAKSSELSSARHSIDLVSKTGRITLSPVAAACQVR